MTPNADTYAERLTPLLVSPDLEGHSGAMFDRKGMAILPSQKLTDSYVRQFMAASEALVSRANVRIVSPSVLVLDRQPPASGAVGLDPELSNELVVVALARDFEIGTDHAAFDIAASPINPGARKRRQLERRHGAVNSAGRQDAGHPQEMQSSTQWIDLRS